MNQQNCRLDLDRNGNLVETTNFRVFKSAKCLEECNTSSLRPSDGRFFLQTTCDEKTACNTRGRVDSPVHSRLVRSRFSEAILKCKSRVRVCIVEDRSSTVPRRFYAHSGGSRSKEPSSNDVAFELLLRLLANSSRKERMHELIPPPLPRPFPHRFPELRCNCKVARDRLYSVMKRHLECCFPFVVSTTN